MALKVENEHFLTFAPFFGHREFNYILIKISHYFSIGFFYFSLIYFFELRKLSLQIAFYGKNISMLKKRNISHCESKSLWNYTLSPGKKK